MRPLLGLVTGLIAAATVVATIVAAIVALVVRTPAPVAFALPEPPDLARAAHVPFAQPSVLLAADGSVIGRFRPEQLHHAIAADAIPPVVEKAVLAIEDARFRDHHGFDVRGIARAALANLRHRTVVQGGSTITQQLVKNIATDGSETMSRKAREVWIAIQLEERYTKDEILAAYLNTVFLGEHAVGFGAAAQVYFNKNADELDLAEAALLAGIIAAPTAYNPRRHPGAAEARRQLVLDRVEAQEWATAEEIAAARAHPPRLQPPRPTVARYPYFVDYIRRWLIDVARVPEQLLSRGGLIIQTTLAPTAQDAARAALAYHLRDDKTPSGAVVTLDPATGEVRALVGGRSWDASQVNLALGAWGAGSGRQPGSAFKPFVLAEAYEQGWRPDTPVAAPEAYHPVTAHDPTILVHNYGRRGYGTMSLAEATWRSINTTYVALAEWLGLSSVAERARALGLDSIPRRGVGASIGIGAYEVTPLEMAVGYAAFANGGRRVTPRPVAVVRNPDGSVLYDARPHAPGPRVLSEEVATLVTDTLRGVVEHGTGAAARLGDRPAAGKTGTTDDYTNAWFVGYTPSVVTAVWVGHRSGNVPMRDVAGLAHVTGGSLPARIWHDVMVPIHEAAPVEDFAVPSLLAAPEQVAAW